MAKNFIIRSKNVFDGKHHSPQPMAIAVSGKRIVRILPWDYQEHDFPGDYIYKKWNLIDYGDRYIQYSFIDAHTHIFNGAVDASDYVCSDLSSCQSEEECVEKIHDYAVKHPEARRIRGSGWFVGNWKSGKLPDKISLDKAIPDRPVYLRCADAHSYWLNSAALEEAKVVPKPEMKNGQVVTFPNGELSGLLLEPAAYEPADEKFLEFSDEEMLHILENFQKILAQDGVAGASEMFAQDYIPETYRQFDLLKKVDEEGKMAAQVFAYTKLFGYTDFTEFFKMKRHFNSPHFHIAGVKGFVDGVTETHTGMLLEPYTDDPSTCGENLPLWPKDKMQEEIIEANRQGIQVRLHCIADGSVRMALDMYEESKRVNGNKDMRNTIEHIENIHPDDLGRFKEIGVIPSMQPYHLVLAKNGTILRLGEERVKWEWAFRSILDHGGEIALGTDFPVVSINPFPTIYAAVVRKDDQTRQPTGFNPDEKMTMEEAIRGYTQEAAKVYHAEQDMGTIEEEKYADLIVLNQNLFEAKEEEILNTKVDVNYFEGELIYNSL